MTLWALLGMAATVFPQATQVVMVNEVMASNDLTLPDQTGDHADWIEVYNPGPADYDLTDHWLSDDLLQPLKFQLTGSSADLTVPAGGHLLIWASGVPSRGPTHLSFSLSATGEHVSITAPDGVTLIDSVSFGEQLTDVSYGRSVDGAANWLFFPAATPALTNNGSPGAIGFLQPPLFSQPSGFHATDFSLTISSSEPGTTIYYSLDGSEPGAVNVGGTPYTYKNLFPQHPGSPFGPMLTDTLRSYVLTGPLSVTDLSPLPNDLPQRSSTNTASYPPSYMPTTPVRKGTVVKARAFKPGYLPSAVATHTYFITPGGASPYQLPVLALSTDADHLFGYEDGLYTAGEDYDNWRTTHPSGIANGGTPANWQRDTEFPVGIEYFETGESTRAFGHNGGLRLHGGWTKAQPRKSFRLYFRSSYGPSTLTHPVFPEQPWLEQKRLIVRNSGNDEAYTNLRDISLQKMVAHMRFETQAARSLALFLNGEFWGVHHLRERYDKHYLFLKYGIPEDQVDIVENPWIWEEGSPDFYQSVLDLVSTADMTQAAAYDQVATMVDLDCFIDYLSACVFVGNTDWPHNNFKMYRKRTTAYEPGAPYGHDGRLRWLLYDTDWGFNLIPTRDASFDYLAWATSPTGNGYGSWSTLLIRRLLLNPVIRDAFINRHADMLNSAYRTTRTTAVIDGHKDLILPDMQQEHFPRWVGRPGSMATWNYNLSFMYTYAQERPAYARQEVLDKFGLPAMQELTVDVSDATHGYVHVNSIDILESTPGVDPLPYPWSGLYFETVPITLTAVALPGHEFLYWEGDLSSTSASITLDLTAGVFVRAVFGVQEVCADTVLHYWHFNALPNNALTNVPADMSLLPGAEITYPGTGAGYMDRTNTTEGSDLNALPGTVSGRALRVRNPSDTRTLVIAAPSTGHRDVELSFATMRTSNGAEQQTVSYTIAQDQSNWVQLAPTRTIGPDFEVHTYSLRDSVATYDEPFLAFRITFSGPNAGGTQGNHRFDNLVVRAAPIPTTVATLCTDSTFTFNGIAYDTTGTHLVEFPDSSRCARFMILDLQPFMADTSVSLSGGTLSMNGTATEIQWVDCNDGMTPIPGETGPDFTPDTNGTYAVMGLSNGCPWISGCHYVMVTGVPTHAGGGIVVFPNPASHHTTIVAEGQFTGVHYVLLDRTGRQVGAGAVQAGITTVPLHHLAQGVYVLQIVGAVEQRIRLVKY